jgi:hypothetical protein
MRGKYVVIVKCAFPKTYKKTKANSTAFSLRALKAALLDRVTIVDRFFALINNKCCIDATPPYLISTLLRAQTTV